MLEVLKDNKLYLNLKKYKFLIESLIFLGFVISATRLWRRESLQLYKTGQLHLVYMKQSAFMDLLPFTGDLLRTLVL